MEFKGTKGKWRINKDNEIGILISSNNPMTDILTIFRYGNKLEENSNALLILKAPEMLDMLKTVSNCLWMLNTKGTNELAEEIDKLIEEATKF